MSIKPICHGLAFVIMVISASPAKADNCSGLSDCGGVVTGAAAAAGLAVLIAAFIRLLPLLTSLAVDLSPLGRARGILEAITGVDTLTGQKLSWLERAIGLIPGGRTARAAEEAASAALKAERSLGKEFAAVAKGDDILRVEVRRIRPKDVPENWALEAGRKDGHIKWINPKNPHEYVRIKPDGTITQVQNGKAFDKNGNKVGFKSEDAHNIKLEDFIFRK